MNHPSIKPAKNATIEWSEEAGLFVVTEAEEGESINPKKLLIAASNQSSEIITETVNPEVTTEKAQETADKLNKMVEGVVLAHGETPITTVSGSNLASLITITNVADKPAELITESVGWVHFNKLYPGFVQTFSNLEEPEKITYSVNPETTQALAETIPELANTEPVNGSVVTDENGTHLKVLSQWSNGFTAGSIPNITENITAGLLEASTMIETPGESIEPVIEEHYRRAEVNQTTRRAYFYDNDTLVYDFPVAVGKSITPTTAGEFRVFWQTPLQDMGCNRPDLGYCTTDVPWVTYFNGDEAFHGAYWHNDFGNPSSSRISHGCVNMLIPDAKAIYEFLQVGTPVSVYW